MPVPRSDIHDDRPSDCGTPKKSGEAGHEKRQDAARQVNGMCTRKQIYKRTTGGRRNVEASCGELAPSEPLSKKKAEPQNQSDSEPGIFSSSRSAAAGIGGEDSSTASLFARRRANSMQKVLSSKIQVLKRRRIGSFTGIQSLTMVLVRGSKLGSPWRTM